MTARPCVPWFRRYFWGYRYLPSTTGIVRAVAPAGGGFTAVLTDGGLALLEMQVCEGMDRHTHCVCVPAERASWVQALCVYVA
jgi:hypothetical protein